MAELIESNRDSGLYHSLKNLAQEILSAVQNRFELFVVELHEEKARVLELFLWTAITLFLGITALMVLTAAMLLLFTQEIRLYMAASLSVGYFLLSGYSVIQLKKRLKQITQFHRQWLESLK